MIVAYRSSGDDSFVVLVDVAADCALYRGPSFRQPAPHRPRKETCVRALFVKLLKKRNDFGALRFSCCFLKTIFTFK